MELEKYYFSIDQLFNDYCPVKLIRKYKNIRNIVMKADLWNINSEIIGYIQFRLKDDNLNKLNINETCIYLSITSLDLMLESIPNIDLNQSVIDYISSLSNVEFKDEKHNKKYIINFDNYIMDIDALTKISPGLCYSLTINEL
jgi:hypothetical protein